MRARSFCRGAGLGAGLEQLGQRALGRQLAGAAPIQVEQDVHVALAALDLGHTGLIHFQAGTQLGLRETGMSSQLSKVLAQHFVATVVNGDQHKRMLVLVTNRPYRPIFAYESSNEKSLIQPFRTSQDSAPFHCARPFERSRGNRHPVPTRPDSWRARMHRQ